MYQLGENDEFTFAQAAEQVPDVSWSGYGYNPEVNPNVYSGNTWGTPSQSTDSWWSSITGALVPLSTAAANVIRAVTGQSPTAQVPAGYTRNSQGQLVRLPSQGFDFQSLLLPAALGVGAYMLLKRK